jgi:hypothetical protein
MPKNATKTHKSLLCRHLQRFCPTYATLTLSEPHCKITRKMTIGCRKTTAVRMALKPLYQARSKGHYYWRAASYLMTFSFAQTKPHFWWDRSPTMNPLHVTYLNSIPSSLYFVALDCQSLLIFRCISRWPICCHLGSLSGVPRVEAAFLESIGSALST